MLREFQKKAILQFFKIEEAPFKLLILDERTRNILAALFRVSDLREAGICAHFLLGMNNPDTKDIPAVYYVRNFNSAINDICEFKYSRYYINSATQIKRADLENLAIKASESRNANRIRDINDTFTDYISLQQDLFSFDLKDSYLKDYSQEIVLSLFSIFVTLKKNPYIVGNLACSSVKNNILKLLENKIKNTKLIKNTVKKPLLILVDRDIDLITPMLHSLGFLEIINDIFNITLNKVNLGNESINLDVDNSFFIKQRFNDFTDVVDLINQEIISYKKEMALKNISVANIDGMLEIAPELQKKNAIVNNLLTISLKVIDEIKARKLDDFYTMETKFVKENLMELSEQGTTNDIIRLCVSFLGTPNVEFVEPLLEKRNIKTNVISYIKKFQQEDTSYGSILKNKMKNLIFKKSLPLINYVEDILLKVKNNNITDSYETSIYNGTIYFNEISEVFVFVNGGVTYTELKELKEIEKKYAIPIILGGTEILNAQNLIEQLEKASQ